jgi:small subunit ribosomal protein S8
VSKLQDPIADYLTRIRNAIMARHPKVDVPASKIKREITKVLVDEGYLRD